jgi:hypothetical protein
MRSVKHICLTALIACALGAVAAAPAFAERNPEWYVNGSLLTGTELVLSSTESVQVLESSLTKPLTCSNLRLTGHNKIWNDEHPPEPLLGGLSLETIAYSGCAYGTAGTCEVSTKGRGTWGEIETNALHSRLVYLTEKAAEKENVHETGMLFEPESGTTFVELSFQGTGCPIFNEVAVKGTVATKNIPNPLTGAGEPLSEELSHYIEAPAAAITKTFYREGGKIVEAKDKLTFFGAEAKYVGKARLWLSSDSSWSMQ